MKIVVLAGGLSPERDVSLSSGSLVANALAEMDHRVLLVDLYCGLPELSGKTPADFSAAVEPLFHDKNSSPYSYKVCEEAPDLDTLRKNSGNGKSLIGKNVIELCLLADIVFCALHGSIGENGQLQAMFDILGIKYTGTGYLGSAIAMNKGLSKQLMKHAGIKTADWVCYKKEKMEIEEVVREVGFPCVVKPQNGGSSVGISMAENLQELKKAIALAETQEPDILIEKKISGNEFSIGVMKGEALPIIEIIPKQGFYDYKNKYQAGFTQEICPARLSGEETKRLQSLAVRVHEILGLGSYSRIDFLYDEKEKEFYCLEANTLPGMTPTSLIPQEAKAAGISYQQLCNKIIELSL